MPAKRPTLGETDFPINLMLKWEGCFQTIWLTKEKNVQYLTAGVLSGSLLPKSNYTGGDARVSEDDKQSNTNLRRIKDLLFFRYLLKASKYSRNPVFRCTSSPLFRISVLGHLKASLNASETLCQLRNQHGLFLRLKFRFLSFLKGALLPNYNNT